MCGICGFTRSFKIESGGSGPGSDVADGRDLSLAKRMCDIIAHRGPDGEGFLESGDVVFGHRRLSLIDLDGGAQPMSRDGEKDSATHVAGDAPALSLPSAPSSPLPMCPASTYQIVFNGEIYNYQELRSELEGMGWSFSTSSDTEVLLVSYIAWGKECLRRLRGMFAFAVYDASSRELFLARDAFGIKPLYWMRDAAGDIAFASESKSLLAHPLYERALNYSALEQYMSFQYNPLPETFFKGIYKLSAGCCLIFDLASGRLSEERWFFPSYDIDSSLSPEDAAASIESAIKDSVSHHKIADVEVGSFLSSGVDSNYMAACLAAEQPDMRAFTVGFATEDGAKYNEIDYAADAASYLGVEHISHEISPEELWDALPDIQYHMDEPLADPAAAALWFVDREAARHVKAVLSGEGADELFGGYPIYQTSIENKRISWIPRPVLRAGAAFLARAGERGANYLMRASTPVEERFIGNAYIFDAAERDRILVPQPDDVRPEMERGRAPEDVVSGTYIAVKDQDEALKMQSVDLNWWLVGDILLKTDKMSMAHSLESRVPFLDAKVWEVARTLPERARVNSKTSKVALRQAAERTMPSDYTTKPKLGFPVPVRVWLREEKHYERVREALLSDTGRRFFDTEEALALLDDHKAGVADNSRKIWVLYTFITWYDRYFGDDAGTDAEA